MRYIQLRDFLINSEKYPGCKTYQRAPLIHDGFPGTFNLSFTEYDMIKDFGGYDHFSKDQIFSTIQSCVRPQDILENLKYGKGLWKYLGVFEMSDIGGQITLSKKEDIKKLHSWHLKLLVDTLVKLGLDKKKIYPSYCAGGNISEITNGKYNFNFIVPEDTFTKEEFIKAGIPKENLIPDKTRDTFLSLHINMPTPWGYRNEINYNLGTKENPKMLDIATLEYFKWIPVYKSKERTARNINGLREFEHTISVGGIGVERLCVAVNKLKSVQEVDYIKEFYDLFKELYPELTDEQRIKAGEVIRALHRIYSDIKENKITRLGNNRTNKIKWFLQVILANLKKFDEEKLKKLLEKHAEVQPWHKNLKAGIEPTIERIKTYSNAPQKSKIEAIDKLKESII